MSDFPSLDQVDDLPPGDVLRAVRRYIEQNQVETREWDLFEDRPDTERVSLLELIDVPADQIEEDDDDYRSVPVMLLLPPEDEDPGDFGEDLKAQIVAGHCTISRLGNGRCIVLGDGQLEMALLTRGRGVWWRAEDFLDHRAGRELRDADGPPISMHVGGDIYRPLPGRSPESQLDLICEAIETRGAPRERTRVYIKITPWSIQGADLYLSADLIDRLSRNQVSISISALPFTGRRKTLQVEPIPDGFEIPEPDVHEFYETLRREAAWLRARGPAPTWVPGCWTWLVETDLGWYLIDGDEEPRTMGFGGPLL